MKSPFLLIKKKKKKLRNFFTFNYPKQDPPSEEIKSMIQNKSPTPQEEKKLRSNQYRHKDLRPNQISTIAKMTPIKNSNNHDNDDNITETEYIPTDEEEDLHEQFVKLNRKLEAIHKEEENIRKELRIVELKLRKKIKL